MLVLKNNKFFSDFKITNLNLRLDMLYRDWCDKDLWELIVSDLSEREVIELIECKNITSLTMMDYLKRHIFSWCLLLNYQRALMVLLRDDELDGVDLDKSIFDNVDCVKELFDAFSIISINTEYLFYEEFVFKYEFYCSVLKKEDIERLEKLLLDVDKYQVSEFAKIVSYGGMKERVRGFCVKKEFNSLLNFVKRAEISLEDPEVISYICANCNIDTIKELEKLGLNLESHFICENNRCGNSSNVYALDVALSYNLSIVPYLISKGGNINFVYSNGASLLLSVFTGVEDVENSLRTLFDNGFDLGKVNIDMDVFEFVMPLASVRQLERAWAIFECVIDKGYIFEDVNSIVISFFEKISNITDCSTKEEVLERVCYLFSNCVSVDALSMSEKDKLIRFLYTSWDYSTQITIELVNLGLDVNVKAGRYSLVGLALKNYDFELLTFLVENGLDIPSAVSDLKLNVADKEDKIGSVDIFFENILNLLEIEYYTNEYESYSIIKVFKYLIDNKLFKYLDIVLDVISKEYEEYSVLTMACKLDYKDLVDYVLKNLKSEYYLANNGKVFRNPLSVSSSKGIVTRLLEVGMLEVDTGIPLHQDFFECRNLDLSDAVSFIKNEVFVTIGEDIPF